jgi:hypothetical protein
MNSSEYFAAFCVEALYYLPHFIPVADEMKRQGLPHAWLFFNEAQNVPSSVAGNLRAPIIHGTPENAGVKAAFYIFGNSYNSLVSVPGKTVLIYHGIGTKACYYGRELNKFHIRFVEGEYRRGELDARSPEPRQLRPVVGFSKLDPAVLFSSLDSEAFLISLGLDPSLKTVLYAPTYAPSSILGMDKRFPEDCGNLNVIIKPHQFTYNGDYKKQVQLFEHWAKSKNVYLTGRNDFNILPFFAVSDVLISDESSAIFEFAALGKPVIRNRFLTLRTSFRIFPWKLQKRMDARIECYSGVARNAYSYDDTLQLLQYLLENPYENNSKIKQYSRELLGEVDGKVSERIVNYLSSHLGR